MEDSFRKEDLLNALLDNGTCVDYEKMYLFLFNEVSKALAILKGNGQHANENAVELLKNAQCKTEEIFINTDQIRQESRIYSGMMERLSLQSIAYHIKEGSDLVRADKNSLTERERKATEELEKELQAKLDTKTVKQLLPVIWGYTDKLESIQFSLGMKVGARLELLLTSGFEYDF